MENTYLDELIETYGFTLLSFLTSRLDGSNQPYDIVEFLNGKKFHGLLKKLKTQKKMERFIN